MAAFSTFDEVAQAIDAVLNNVPKDHLLKAGTFGPIELTADDGRGPLIMVSSTADPKARRNQDPLEFSEESRGCCFCRPKRHLVKCLSEFSTVMVKEGEEANLFAKKSTSEPLEQHLEDTIELTSLLKSKNLMGINLPGSGASYPQHFHTQIHPLQYRATTGIRSNIISTLWHNLRAEPNPFLSHAGIQCFNITFPLWGWKILFKCGSAPRQIGRCLHRVIHCGLREGSRMELSYNLYVQWERESCFVTVFLREVKKESPFLLKEVETLVEQTDPEAGRQLKTSYNRRWKWGLVECLGGLLARDELFANTANGKFDFSFWERVFAIVSVTDKYRGPIRDQLERLLPSLAPE